MVDRIDRPEAPPPYQITRAKDAKENQHREPDQRGEQEKRYQKQIAEKEWTKFDRRTTTIKPLSVPRESVARCLFKGVRLHNGVGILAVDVHWKDGRTTAGALILLARLDHFVRLNKFVQGQEVPDEFWAHGATVEFGIVQVVSAGTNMQPAAAPDGKKAAAMRSRVPSKVAAAFGITDSMGHRINWGIVSLYIFLFSIVIIALALHYS